VASTLLASRVMLFVVLTSLVAMNEPTPACAQRDAPAAPVERAVTVFVKPWADVFVDDKLVARGVRYTEIKLPVGEHVIVFGNPGAYDEKRTVFVPSTGDAPDVFVELKRRPSELRVHSNVGEADVEVCTRATTDRPIHVPVMDSPATVEVRVSRRGYSTVTRTIDVAAGRPVRVDVHLAPNDAR
jgi:hypothetical protein